MSSQSFENPGGNSIITCGLTEACNIVCNTPNACEFSQFYLYSNDAYIECSGQLSCQSVKIFSINATSITLNLNGINAFQNGIVYIKQPNQNIVTHCNNELGMPCLQYLLL